MLKCAQNGSKYGGGGGGGVEGGGGLQNPFQSPKLFGELALLAFLHLNLLEISTSELASPYFQD